MKGIKFSNLGDFKKIKDKQEIIEQRKILKKVKINLKRIVVIIVGKKPKNFVIRTQFHNLLLKI